MNQARRNILRGTVSTTLLSVAVAAGLLRPGMAKASSLSSSLTQSLRNLQSGNPVFSEAIRLNVPNIAVDGATVFLEVSCSLPDVDSLMVFVDRNPQPLVAAYQLAPEVQPALQMRIKVSQTAQVWVIVRSGGKFYKTAKSVKVTTGGCGVGVN